ncbi:MAG: hypothetical protein LBB76_10260 [Azoarcus sp.]|jgi:hypothetical protein|nr:hypothetical protein [Azoarcus sp.]
MKRISRLAALFFCAAFIVGAARAEQAERGNASDVAAEPHIMGSTRSGGRGTPNGRSDSAARFAALTKIADDPEYGFTAGKPVKVGLNSADLRAGVAREQLYLNGLRGPAGEPVEYERRGSCCEFETPYGLFGKGLLDVFVVSYGGQVTLLYLNAYDEGEWLLPQGFTPRRE